jgi:hypothetical protein
MFILYDTDTDTLQSRTRRYDRDRHLMRVLSPSDWPTISATDLPDYIGEAVQSAVADCPTCDAVYDAAYESIGV